MEMNMGNNGGVSGDEREGSDSRNGKRAWRRHTTRQIQQLEAYFKNCPNPDESQRRQLSNELGLELKQIKFWFQNKRSQTKAQNERVDNSFLRSESERMHCENMAMKEALKNVICPACGGPPFGEEERRRNLLKLQMENAKLREERERVSALLAKCLGKSIPPVHGDSMEIMAPKQRLGSPALDLDLNAGTSDRVSLPFQLEGIPELEKALMCKTAAGAFDELSRLLRIDAPLWTTTNPDGRFIIHRDSYEKLFPRTNHFNTLNARIESSRSAGTVPINALSLVETFLDVSKWVEFFPTIVNKASIIEVLQTGLQGNRHGALQLMFEQLHILSPLVPPREFYFLRLCQQPVPGTWVIVDVSYDCFNEANSPFRAWKLPSGCMIQEMPNGYSKVTWVEHVEVDDKIQTHKLYRDLICGNAAAYGAERWIVILERMCERIVFSFGETSPTGDIEAMCSAQGKRNVMELSHRMVRNFCATLSMSRKLDFPLASEGNNSGVRVSVRKSCESGQPGGMIVSAATSLWLPLPPWTVFSFFKDERTRMQWDILSNGNPIHKLTDIPIGANPANSITVIQPLADKNMLMLQESCTDGLGSLVVYAALDMRTMKAAISGDDPSVIPILPSGFVISGDGRPHNGNRNARSGGSLLTVALQILISTSTSCSSSSSGEFNMESIATVNTLISSTVQKIKFALNCSDLD
ncbi:homeobox-leucine zipper protein ROC8-like [Euphorbia lathyris]|uniref:homeobox-leucine zipper protein ROC8-like n=1 Tax=Euphorbia lathyris TaxID=212925 RepID=UPI0033131A33